MGVGLALAFALGVASWAAGHYTNSRTVTVGRAVATAAVSNPAPVSAGGGQGHRLEFSPSAVAVTWTQLRASVRAAELMNDSGRSQSITFKMSRFKDSHGRALCLKPGCLTAKLVGAGGREV